MAIAKPVAADVIALIDAGLSDAVVTAIIDDAALIAESAIAGYTDDRQTAIVKWLAAHLIASTDEGGVHASESLGGASDSYHRAQLGDALKGTIYGQQALLLDTDGNLPRVGKARASVERI